MITFAIRRISVKTRTILGFAAGLTFALATNVRAQTVSIWADQAGTTIYRTGGTNYVGFAGANWGPRVGEYFSQGSALVLPFQLPTLPVGAQFVTPGINTSSVAQKVPDSSRRSKMATLMPAFWR